jgi:hypothetical protein
LVTVLAAALAFPSAAQAVPGLAVRVTIDKVETEEFADFGFESPDFYSIVEAGPITDSSGRQGPIINDSTADPEPDWSFGFGIEAALGRAPITIEIRDDDNGARHFDDHADIDPTNSGDPFNLELEVNFAVCASQTPQDVPSTTSTRELFPDTNAVSGDASIKCGEFVWSEGLTGERNKAKIRYKVEVFDGDQDRDSLFNSWETAGIDADNDGTVDLALQDMGAQWDRKDVFVEIDCLVAADHSHCPSSDALTDVVRAFSNSPVDGNAGMQLHLDVGNLYGCPTCPSTVVVPRNVPPFNGMAGSIGDMGGGGTQITEAGNTVIDWNVATGGPRTSFYALKRNNFNAGTERVRDAVFRYAIFGHQTNLRTPVNDCTSGWEEGRPSNDFMVTLGGRRDLNNTPDGATETACWGDTPTDSIDNDRDGKTDEDPAFPYDVDDDRDCVPGTDTDGDKNLPGGGTCETGDVGVGEDGGHSIGSRAEQAGTFMHELGHTLGLRHGGMADTPNNMPNYLSLMNYAFQSCDVPRSPTGATAPIPGGCDYSRTVVNLEERVAPGPPGLPGLDECLGLGPGLGFGRVNWDNDTPVVWEGTTCPAPNTTNVSADINRDGSRTNLPGFDDWSNIFYRFRSLANWGSDGRADPGRDEPDPTTIEQAQQHLSALMAPDVNVTVSGPATALPGESLSYTIRTANDGSGPAFAVGLAATRPDGSTSSFNLGDLIVGAEASRTIGYSVPGNACPQTLTVDGTATFTDFARLPLSASGSKDTRVLDVTPPRIQLSVSPTSLWPANHKLATITANVAASDECDPNPSVRLVSVTSNEPDSGTGPGDIPGDVSGAAIGTDDRSFQVRAERAESGSGRTYTVVYEVRDSSGNATRATATVTVAKSQSSIQSAVFTDWQTAQAGIATGILGGQSVTLSGPIIDTSTGSVLDGSATDYADPSFFTPPLPHSDVIEIRGSADPNSYALRFGTLIRDPIIHLNSLASTLTFPAGTKITRLSGSPGFTVSISGSSVTGTLNGGGIPNDSSGSVQLQGVFDFLSFTAATPGYLDGIRFQVGARL